MTKAVVAICVVFVPRLAVGAVGTPVRAGLARSALAERSTVRLPDETARGDETLVM
jgi:hypothetical protein